MGFSGSEYQTASPEHGPENKLVQSIDRSLETLEKTRDTWVQNVMLLKARIPHDDVMLDQKTFSFHVLLNAWLSNVHVLGEMETELREQKKRVFLPG